MFPTPAQKHTGATGRFNSANLTSHDRSRLAARLILSGLSAAHPYSLGPSM